MPKIEIVLVDGGKLNFDKSFLQFNRKKKNIQRVLLDFTLNATY